MLHLIIRFNNSEIWDKMNKKLIEGIQKLKDEQNAIILAHNYQPGEVQDIADYLGDSLELSRTAARTNADVIVLCGVHFMAETAAILSPEKKVLLPDRNAGCQMADMITAVKLRELKKDYPDAVVVGYVNTSAAVKAEMDVCCTSSNAVDVINSLTDVEEIIFVPDKYLADYVSRKTRRDFIVWDGYCPTHAHIRPEHILEKKKLHPGAEVIVHPECIPEVINLANKVLSTEGMCRYAQETNTKELIIGTDVGILHRLEKENPQKKFYPASKNAICPNMRVITLKKVLCALEEMKYVINVPEDIRIKARHALDRMLKIV